MFFCCNSHVLTIKLKEMFRNDPFNTLNIKVPLFVFLLILMKKFTYLFEFNLTIKLWLSARTNRHGSENEKSKFESSKFKNNG